MSAALWEAWCHDCRRQGPVRPADGWEDADDPQWQCVACGSLILCDECGQPWTDVHAGRPPDPIPRLADRA